MPAYLTCGLNPSSFQWLYHINGFSSQASDFLKSLKQAASGLRISHTSAKVAPGLAFMEAHLGLPLPGTSKPSTSSGYLQIALYLKPDDPTLHLPRGPRASVPGG